MISFKRCAVFVIMALALPLMAAKAGLRFDGKNDGINVAKPYTNGWGAATATMWVRGEYKWGNLMNGAVIVQFVDHVGFMLYGRDGTGSGFLNWDKSITASGRWQHLAAVWSNPSAGDGKMKLYVDGIRQETTRAYDGGTNGLLYGPGGLAVCGVFNSGIGRFRGELEDVRLYSRALTENEILAVYTGEGSASITNGLALWYPLKDKDREIKLETNSCVILDQSGKGNHGQLCGAPLWMPAGDNQAEINRRDQIAASRKWLQRKKTECEDRRRSLTKILGEHPENADKWRGRFEELNRCFDLIKTNEICWTIALLREYNELLAEAGLAALFGEYADGTGKEPAK